MAIKKREDVNPEEGIKKYGNVEFADPTNNKYPIDTEEHVKAAWAYIHNPKDADEYSEPDRETIKKKIRHAAEHYGLHLNPD